jgi:hypothetical protein
MNNSLGKTQVVVSAEQPIEGLGPQGVGEIEEAACEHRQRAGFGRATALTPSSINTLPARQQKAGPAGCSTDWTGPISFW